jgi:hypothetical protein
MDFTELISTKTPLFSFQRSRDNRAVQSALIDFMPQQG